MKIVKLSVLAALLAAAPAMANEPAKTKHVEKTTIEKTTEKTADTMEKSGTVEKMTVLDGKTFEGVIIEQGKKEKDGQADNFVFENGKFRSTLCDQYGFKPADYKVTTKGTNVAFEAKAMNDKDGLNDWKGTVKGDKIEGTFVSKTGSKVVKYSFKGTMKKLEAPKAE